MSEYANYSDSELTEGVDDIPRVRELARRLDEAKAEIVALRRLAESALAIKGMVETQQAFSRQLSALAAEARRTGLFQTHRIVEQPRVHDYGDVIADLCAELDRWQKTRKRTV